MSKQKKNRNKVVKDMKECFRAFHLPVNKSSEGKDIRLVFNSHICNDHVCADVAAIYDKQKECVGIDLVFHPPVPMERVSEVIKLLNLLNGMNTLYSISICQCCNVLKMRAMLFLADAALPIDKYKRLIKDLLEYSYFTFPLFMEVMNGAAFEEAYELFNDDHKDLLIDNDTYTEAIKEEILKDGKSVLSDCYFKLDEKSLVNDSYVQGYKYDKIPGLEFVLGIAVRGVTEAFVVSMSSTFTVPDDKEDIVMKLVNLINKMCLGNHMYFSHQKKNVVLLTGVMLNNGSLDRKELKHALTTLIGNGFRMIPIVYEQLTSTESPEVLILKAFDSQPDTTSCS